MKGMLNTRIDTQHWTQHWTKQRSTEQDRTGMYKWIAKLQLNSNEGSTS